MSAHSASDRWWVPDARLGEYVSDRLPTTEEVRVAVVERLPGEMASGALLRVAEQASEILKHHPNEPDIVGCAKGLGGYLRGRSGLPASELEDLIFRVWLGVGFHLLEDASKAQREGLVHPTIWNAMVVASMGDGEEASDGRISRVYSIARDGGYSAYRHRLMAEDVFQACDFSQL
ncbi:hypothetical protein DN585_01460 [Intrasporangium calvum]|nr:hypothetical protein DN585_01460 [Intrasporangium calvum]